MKILTCRYIVLNEQISEALMIGARCLISGWNAGGPIKSWAQGTQDTSLGKAELADLAAWAENWLPSVGRFSLIHDPLIRRWPNMDFRFRSARNGLAQWQIVTLQSSLGCRDVAMLGVDPQDGFIATDVYQCSEPWQGPRHDDEISDFYESLRIEESIDTQEQAARALLEAFEIYRDRDLRHLTKIRIAASCAAHIHAVS